MHCDMPLSKQPGGKFGHGDLPVTLYPVDQRGAIRRQRPRFHHSARQPHAGTDADAKPAGCGTTRLPVQNLFVHPGRHARLQPTRKASGQRTSSTSEPWNPQSVSNGFQAQPMKNQNRSMIYLMKKNNALYTANRSIYE